MDGTVHIVSLEQKPCVVQYLEEYNKFIIGTYELYPSTEEARLKLNSHLEDYELKKDLEKINYRAGKLILLRGNDVSVPSIEYEFDCQVGGGVFDAKVSYNKLDSSFNIYVAHSNGSIGIYKLSLHCGNKICLKEHIIIEGSKMLTSIDIFSNPNSNAQAIRSFCHSPSSNKEPLTNSPSNNKLVPRLVVGDSGGFVTVILQNGETIRESVAQGDSIWQVKSLMLASGKSIIVVGSENSSWYIYGFNYQIKELVLLYKNEYKDFSAGVTCISILDVVHSSDYDLIDIMLGSYDETLQTYQIKMSHDGLSRPGVCHKNTLSIDNGGIWRVKPFRGGNNKKQLCIAAMYAGSYILNLDGSESLSTQQSIDGQQKQYQRDCDETLSRLIDTDSLKLSHKPLHYDIDISSCCKTYCIVDFNNSLCLFKTIDS